MAAVNRKLRKKDRRSRHKSVSTPPIPSSPAIENSQPPFPKKEGVVTAIYRPTRSEDLKTDDDRAAYSVAYETAGSLLKVVEKVLTPPTPTVEEFPMQSAGTVSTSKNDYVRYQRWLRETEPVGYTAGVKVHRTPVPIGKTGKHKILDRTIHSPYIDVDGEERHLLLKMRRDPLVEPTKQYYVQVVQGMKPVRVEIPNKRYIEVTWIGKTRDAAPGAWSRAKRQALAKERSSQVHRQLKRTSARTAELNSIKAGPLSAAVEALPPSLEWLLDNPSGTSMFRKEPWPNGYVESPDYEGEILPWSYEGDQFFDSSNYEDKIDLSEDPPQLDAPVKFIGRYRRRFVESDGGCFIDDDKGEPLLLHAHMVREIAGPQLALEWKPEAASNEESFRPWVAKYPGVDGLPERAAEPEPLEGTVKAVQCSNCNAAMLEVKDQYGVWRCNHCGAPEAKPDSEGIRILGWQAFEELGYTIDLSDTARAIQQLEELADFYVDRYLQTQDMIDELKDKLRTSKLRGELDALQRMSERSKTFNPALQAEVKSLRKIGHNVRSYKRAVYPKRSRRAHLQNQLEGMYARRRLEYKYNGRYRFDHDADVRVTKEWFGCYGQRAASKHPFSLNGRLKRRTKMLRSMSELAVKAAGVRAKAIVDNDNKRRKELGQKQRTYMSGVEWSAHLYRCIHLHEKWHLKHQYGEWDWPLWSKDDATLVEHRLFRPTGLAKQMKFRQFMSPFRRWTLSIGDTTVPPPTQYRRVVGEELVQLSKYTTYETGPGWCDVRKWVPHYAYDMAAFPDPELKPLHILPSASRTPSWQDTFKARVRRAARRVLRRSLKPRDQRGQAYFPSQKFRLWLRWIDQPLDESERRYESRWIQQCPVSSMDLHLKRPSARERVLLANEEEKRLEALDKLPSLSPPPDPTQPALLDTSTIRELITDVSNFTHTLLNRGGVNERHLRIDDDRLRKYIPRAVLLDQDNTDKKESL